MKYSDLIQFEPINEVVKFDRLSDEQYRESLVKGFVFSKAYEDSIIPTICRNLDYTTTAETFGLQIVGSYGTGKSHLMSLFSLVAEDSKNLDFVGSDKAKQHLEKIAGKYKIIRFELGNDQELWDIVCYRIDEGLKAMGVDYSLAKDKSLRSYGEKIAMMMAYFEQKFPDHGLMVIIDEMLSYLKGRSGSDALNRDLAVLQGLGQASDKSKFRMVFGVQELIYTAPEFQFAADTLLRVNDRYKDLTITKQDVQFVVQRRLLKKNDAQKEAIRKHLAQFTSYFTEISKDTETYVELFPVNPSYFDNFQRIKVAKAQREILKTLSGKFASIMNQEVPTTQPGLIGYDSYWEDMATSADMQTNPDVRRVKEIMELIYQKIEDNFKDARAKKAPLAKRIAAACAIKILQDDLQRQNGVSAEALVDDLCYLDATCFDRDMLKDVIGTTAQQIVTATVGQYFEKNDHSQEFHLRIQGGVNYEQKIKDYVTHMTPDNLDSYWFSFLVENLPVQEPQYRREFKIFKHRINWASHKLMLDGYLFFGNPDQRSTTHPEQNFYIYFMPIFNKKNIKIGSEADSIYIRFDDLSEEMKDYLRLFAAVESLKSGAPTNEKMFYEQFRKNYSDKLKNIFGKEFATAIKVVYQGKEQTLTPTQLTGPSKDSIIDNIATMLLEDYFCNRRKDYPKFTLLPAPLAPQNRATSIKATRQKIAQPQLQNRTADAILAGMGLLDQNRLSLDGSIYAQSLMHKMEEKGEGKVINRDEILYRFWKDDQEEIWRSTDFDIDADLEYLVLATMVALGEIEIDYPGGKNINATNIKEIIEVKDDWFWSFSHIRRPKGLNQPAVKELFLGIVGHDLSNQLDNPQVFSQLLTEAQKLAQEIVTLQYKIKGGIMIDDVEILDAYGANTLSQKLDAIKGICDKVQAYNTKAKMRNLPWSQQELHKFFEAKSEIQRGKRLLEVRDSLKSRISYLNQALQYVYDQAFEKDIKDALEKVGDVIAKNSDAALNTYNTELDTLIDRYAKWYLAEYERLHITAFENNRKQHILNSDKKRVCDIACQEDFISVSDQFSKWENEMAELTINTGMVTLQSIKNVPYQGFNPRLFAGKSLPSLDDLDDQLDKIYDAIEHTLHATLEDQNLLQNGKDALDESEIKVVEKFHNEYATAQNVGKIIEIIKKLHKGIRKITLTYDEIQSAIDGLVKPEDAIKAFKKLIESKMVGSTGDDIRIILK